MSTKPVWSYEKALRHPLRRQLLRSYLNRKRPASPSELAKELKESVPYVAYHIKGLVQAGLLKPAGTEPVRGSTKHFYRPNRRLAKRPDVKEFLAAP